MEHTLHIYTSESIPEKFGVFRSFSPGWQTYLSGIAEDKYYGTVRKISKTLSVPVLGCTKSGHGIHFTLINEGKKVASFGTIYVGENEGMYKVPSAMGFDGVGKQRLSKIVSGPDPEEIVEMLEEYFGVCLFPDKEQMEKEPEKLLRVRGDEKFKAFCKKDKPKTAKDVVLKLELSKHLPGKIFFNNFRSHEQKPRPHLYLYGCEKENDNSESLVPVRFKDGKLQRISFTEFYETPFLESDDEDLFTNVGPTVRVVTFGKGAPPAFAGKTYTFPYGYLLNRFLDGDRMLLTKKYYFAIMNSDGELLGKFPIKGSLVDVEGDWILVCGATSFFFFGYDPDDKGIFIYRLTESKRTNPEEIKGRFANFRQEKKD